MAEVQMKVRRTARVSETVEAQEGETQLVVSFPEAVPAGKVLLLRVEIAGELKDPEPPA
jgi:hypothetical protein